MKREEALELVSLAYDEYCRAVRVAVSLSKLYNLSLRASVDLYAPALELYQAAMRSVLADGHTLD